MICILFTALPLALLPPIVRSFEDEVYGRPRYFVCYGPGYKRNESVT